jgi:hypothetical protein
MPDQRTGEDPPMTTSIKMLVAAAVVVTTFAALPAEAGRPCRRMCRGRIAANIAEYCGPYRGVLKRACKLDVRTTIIGFCKRQPSGDCYGL